MFIWYGEGPVSIRIQWIRRSPLVPGIRQSFSLASTRLSLERGIHCTGASQYFSQALFVLYASIVKFVFIGISLKLRTLHTTPELFSKKVTITGHRIFEFKENSEWEIKWLPSTLKQKTGVCKSPGLPRWREWALKGFNFLLPRPTSKWACHLTLLYKPRL